MSMPLSSLAVAALEHRLAQCRRKEVELRGEQVCDLLAVAVWHASHTLCTQRPLLAICVRVGAVSWQQRITL